MTEIEEFEAKLSEFNENFALLHNQFYQKNVLSNQ